MISSPKIIVLILSYNGKELLYDSISSYLENDYMNFSVVVIDNGSTDGTMEYVKKQWPNAVEVIRTDKNLKYSGGFNLGLKYAFVEQNADYVLITNNDVKADKNTISALVDTAESDLKIGFTTGKVYYYDYPNILQTVGKHEDPIRWNGAHIGAKENDNGQYDSVSERIFIDDIYTLVSKSVYATVGGYDTVFQFQCEEWDWQARAKKAGFKIYYTYKAKIWHKESMTIGKKSGFKAYYDACNPPLVIAKYKSHNYYKKFIFHHLWSHVIKASVKSIIFDFDVNKFFKIWNGFYDGQKLVKKYNNSNLR